MRWNFVILKFKCIVQIALIALMISQENYTCDLSKNNVNNGSFGQDIILG